MITLGHWYRDSALGIVGAATQRMESLGGSPTVRLEWIAADDSLRDFWVEESRLTEVSDERRVGFSAASSNGHH